MKKVEGKSNIVKIKADLQQSSLHSQNIKR